MSATSFDLAGVTCLLDPRSLELEHWSYNLGVARAALSARRGTPLSIVVSPRCASLMRDLGVPADERTEASTGGSRLARLLVREWRSSRLVARALSSGNKVLLLHVHPLALCLAAFALIRRGAQLSLCLHNDFVGAMRGNGGENRLERVMWKAAALLGRNVQFVAPNRHYARFARQALPPGTPIRILSHPVLTPEDYRQVASSSPMARGGRFALGFFGRVDAGRGAGDFRSWVASHPDAPCVLAGRWTARLDPLPNLEVHELPDTSGYCGLLLRADTLFLDLRDDSYRVGESGVFWDAVGIGARLQYGALPPLYRNRLRKLPAASIDQRLTTPP